jgi:kinesin family protein 2/24
LIKTILEEEELLIGSHKEHIDATVNIVKQDMQLLDVVDRQNSDVLDYAVKLDEILLRKIEMISQVREKLVKFY